MLGLFLDPKHPRGSAATPPAAQTPVLVQLIYQRNCAEALLQLALSALGKAALLADPAVLPALCMLSDEMGVNATVEARELAQAVLVPTPGNM